MELQEIIKRFAILANVSDNEPFPWNSLCEDAGEDIKRHLRDDVVESEHSRRLCAAAAALAFYRHTLYMASCGGMESFTAGEIKIKADPKNSSKIALNVWKDAKNSISDLLKDENFVFQTII